MMKVYIGSFLISSVVLFFGCSVSSSIPPNTIAVAPNKDTFIDKSEVTNLFWREYIFFMGKEHGVNSEQHKNSFPDTIIWKNSYKANYYDPQYDNYPVVGISFEQAKHFCEWRSKVVSTKLNRKIKYSFPSLQDYKLIPVNIASTNDQLYQVDKKSKTFSGICDNASEMLDVKGKSISGLNNKNCLTVVDYTDKSNVLSFRCKAIFQ